MPSYHWCHGAIIIQVHQRCYYGNAVQRATVYLDPDLHRELWLKAVETSTSVSALINNAVREAIAEGSEDFIAFEGKVGEPLIIYYERVRRLMVNHSGLKPRACKYPKGCRHAPVDQAQCINTTLPAEYIGTLGCSPVPGPAADS